MEDENNYSKRRWEYREHTVEARKKAQEDYDKTVIALSGGALGISLAFINGIVGEGPYDMLCLLIGAWISWAVSLSSVLFSYASSVRALTKTIDQIDDDGDIPAKPGGIFTWITDVLNFLSGLFFVAGVGFLIVFTIKQ